MVYITKANAKRILDSIDLTGKTLNDKLYDKPIYIFNKNEEQRLLAVEKLLKPALEPEIPATPMFISLYL